MIFGQYTATSVELLENWVENMLPKRNIFLPIKSLMSTANNAPHNILRYARHSRNVSFHYFNGYNSCTT